MSKKILSLLFLLILLVSVTISYAYFNEQSTDYTSDTDNEVYDEALTSEIDSTFLEEDQDIEIGEMI